MVTGSKVETEEGTPLPEGGSAESENFWRGKTPCWEMSNCPKGIRLDCPAFNCRYLPCWQIEGTFRKIFDYEQGGDGTAVCRLCEVYKKWGAGEALEIKLLLNSTISRKG